MAKLPQVVEVFVSLGANDFSRIGLTVSDAVRQRQAIYKPRAYSAFAERYEVTCDECCCVLGAITR